MGSPLPRVDAVSDAMFAVFAWRSVPVKRSATFVFRRKVVKIEWEKTFGELLE